MRRFLPNGKELETIFDLMPKREKVFFLFFFAIAWVTGILMLIGIDRNYSTQTPDQGGTLREGILGIPSKINPLLAISDADRDLVRLVYSGLMKSDGRGGLEKDLAQSYMVSDDGLSYSFTLREKLFWHDGERVTTDDIIYTINLAKNPRIASPKRANWEGVTPEVVNDREIKFYLRKPYAPFLETTTLGVIPKHIWSKVSPEEFALAEFNTSPIGSGPFKIDSITKNSAGGKQSYILKRFEDHQPASAYLDKIEFYFYPSEEELSGAVQSGAIQSANIILDPGRAGTKTLAVQLPRIIGIFFNQDNDKILSDAKLRAALGFATDRERIVREATAARAAATSLPIPPGTFAYDKNLEEKTFDPERAKKILADAGYKDTDGDGILEKVAKKETTPLRFVISTSNAAELVKAGTAIQEMWKAIGVDAAVHAYEIGDLEQSIIRPRNYSALLFGQVVGYDPDPFAFWHSSQRNDPGLNIALYANTHVDKILEDARATIDADERGSLYRSFQEEIMKDKPAIFLYSPLYYYTVPDDLRGIDLVQIPLPPERFSGISHWYLATRSVWNFLLRFPVLQKF
ncbi:MAG: hypothetical protein HYT34_00825 [Candidatus Ryanbacteria bacterium]|nr:hypothetical protein [Candidatus Ryanbacteria bacterium]